ncbi:MAG: DUF2243 domain-containing protein [Aureliella sp.]
MAAETHWNIRPLVAASTLLGIGMGGFVDGILFHQLLQFHNMLSGPDYYPKTGVPVDRLVVNLEINMFWDGLFHVFTWIMTALGLAMLFHAGQRSDVPWSTRLFVGGLALGWGLFNLVEGIIDHHILNIHHVTETENHLVWDLTFLGAGVLLIIIGLATINAGRRDSVARGSVRVSGV